jgi:addiction module RelE/StbE family toxin
MGKRPERARAVIELSPSAKTDLKKLKKRLNESTLTELYEAFESICNDPLSGKALQGNFTASYSFRFGGNYRIIYNIIKHPQETIIRIQGIGDRKDI